MVVMDLISKIGTERNYNFHSHTPFCDGKASMEQMLIVAINEGMKHWGFSPHSPIDCDSTCNMSKDDVASYFSEIYRVRTLYGNQINIYASMEIDYTGDDWGPSNAYFRALPLDYRIGSVHFIPSDAGMVDVDGRYDSFQNKMREYFHDDIRYVVETFYAQSVKMLEAGGFDIIGHFDKIGHNAGHFKNGIEDELWYQRLVNDMIDLIIEKNVIVELNTKAWSEHNRMFPGVRYLRRLADAHVPILVNSDAHYPDKVNASRNEGFGLLEDVGYDIGYNIN